MTPFSLNIRQRIVEYTRPVVMGILNVTYDSFYAGSRVADADEVRRRTHEMVSEGVDIIDVGAVSTRPGCVDVAVDDELRCLDMALSVIHEVAPEVPVSVDTFRADVARRAVGDMGADIINDISGGNIDPEMFQTVADLRVPYVLTHSRGGINDMHDNTEYDDFIPDVLRDLARKVDRLSLLGVNDVIIDPGFGFSKTLEQNYLLLINLTTFSVFKLPLLVGVSRKSMITKLLNILPEEAVNGTTVLNTIALQRGASILRVHDVRAAREAVELTAHL